MASFDPLRWLLSLAGFAYEWILSRSWISILLQVVPLLFLGSLMLTVWFGGRMSKEKLADRYLELSSPGIAEWENKFFTKLSASPKVQQSNDRNPTGTANGSDTEIPTNPTESSPTQALADRSGDGSAEGEVSGGEKADALEYQVPSYEEMLCRRVELLRSNPQSRFVVGTSLLLKGALANSQKVLRKIAPDDKEGLPKAHAIMALGYLNQFMQSRDTTLVPLLQHHADIAVQWPNTPKDVLMLAADLNWQRGQTDRSVEIIETAAERFPELYPVLLDRANATGKSDLAESARSNAILHFRGILDGDPRNDNVRIQIAQLMGVNDDALDKVEQLLREGIELEPSKGLVRALSEIYRVRFVKHLLEKKGKTDDFSLLSQAVEIDRSNPLIAEQVARLVKEGIRPTRELQQLLRDMLASGEATVYTHAIMSEFYLASDRRPEAIMHLEKVFQSAPTEIMYANNLAYLYAKEGRLEEAEQTARRCLELVQRANVQNQRFLDELLDTLGYIYEEMKKNSDAISSYELSLRFNPERIETRQKLAAIYRGMGNEGIAEAHDRAIEAIRKAQEERLQKNSEAGQDKPTNNAE